MSARSSYVAMFGNLGEALEFEDLVLSSGREFLPAFAIDVLDGGTATPEYWAWLADQLHRAAETGARVSSDIERELSDYRREDDAAQDTEDEAYRERQWVESCR